MLAQRVGDPPISDPCHTHEHAINFQVGCSKNISHLPFIWYRLILQLQALEEIEVLTVACLRAS
jgi:hypothetical protein